MTKGEEMARREKQTDMTAGSPFQIILNFTIPIFIGNVFQIPLQFVEPYRLKLHQTI